MENITKENLRLYREIFEFYDTNKDGIIKYDDLEKILKTYFINDSLISSAQRKSKITTQNHYHSASNTIEFEDFVLLMSKNKYQTKQELIKSFEFFDKNKDEKIKIDYFLKELSTFTFPDNKLNLDISNEILEEFTESGILNYRKLIYFIFDNK